MKSVKMWNPEMKLPEEKTLTQAATPARNYYNTKLLVTVVIVFALVLMVSIIFSDVVINGGSLLIESLGPQFLLFVLGGFIAQMIDGS